VAHKSSITGNLVRGCLKEQRYGQDCRDGEGMYISGRNASSCAHLSCAALSQKELLPTPLLPMRLMEKRRFFGVATMIVSLYVCEVIP
jgi:hypothetical protein